MAEKAALLAAPVQHEALDTSILTSIPKKLDEFDGEDYSFGDHTKSEKQKAKAKAVLTMADFLQNASVPYGQDDSSRCVYPLLSCFFMRCLSVGAPPVLVVAVVVVVVVATLIALVLPVAVIVVVVAVIVAVAVVVEIVAIVLVVVVVEYYKIALPSAHAQPN